MSIKLLPASVNPVDPSHAIDVATSLVPLTQRAITARDSQISLVPSDDAFAWSPSTRQSQAGFIDASLVDDSKSDDAGQPGEYVSGWAWSHHVERTAVAHYLSYAAGPASWSGHVINLYA